MDEDGKGEDSQAKISEDADEGDTFDVKAEKVEEEYKS